MSLWYDAVVLYCPVLTSLRRALLTTQPVANRSTIRGQTPVGSGPGPRFSDSPDKSVQIWQNRECEHQEVPAAIVDPRKGLGPDRRPFRCRMCRPKGHRGVGKARPRPVDDFHFANLLRTRPHVRRSKVPSPGPGANLGRLTFSSAPPEARKYAGPSPLPPRKSGQLQSPPGERLPSEPKAFRSPAPPVLRAPTSLLRPRCLAYYEDVPNKMTPASSAAKVRPNVDQV